MKEEQTTDTNRQLVAQIRRHMKEVNRLLNLLHPDPTTGLFKKGGLTSEGLEAIARQCIERNARS